MDESTEDQKTEVSDPPIDTSKCPTTVTIYVCPDCGSWYGSSQSVDLALQVNQRSSMRNLHDEDPSAWGSPVGTRIECQHCKQRGVSVKRVALPYVLKAHVVERLQAEVEAAYQREEKISRVKIPRTI